MHASRRRLLEGIGAATAATVVPVGTVLADEGGDGETAASPSSCTWSGSESRNTGPNTLCKTVR